MDVGDTILHPRYGVGTIESIESRTLDGITKRYYVVPKPSIASTIFIPVDITEEIGIRHLSSIEKMNEAVDILYGITDPVEHPQELRNVNWSDPVVLASVIRKRAISKKGKYPKMSEAHQLKRAQKLLSEELVAVLGMTHDKASDITDVRFLLKNSLSSLTVGKI